MMKNFWKDEQGQDMVEYSLLLGFLTMAGVAFYQTMHDNMNTIWSNTNTKVSDAATASAPAQ
jgi:Flp pilus assembly pilin Flp